MDQDEKDHVVRQEIKRGGTAQSGQQRSLMNSFKRSQRNTIGHVLRRESLFRMVLEGRILEENINGRPWMMITATIQIRLLSFLSGHVNYNAKAPALSEFLHLSVEFLIFYCVYTNFQLSQDL